MWRRRQRDLWEPDRHQRLGTVNLGNKGYGIDIGSANNTVGGTADGEANVIAFNTKAGIGLENLNTDTGNTISANSIYSNKTLGIDLGESGVPLQNNSGVAQFGPNDLQNYPVLATAVASNDSTTITGSLTSPADHTFTIQFLATPPPIRPVTAKVKRSSAPRR